MGEVFGLLAFIMSMVAVILAGTALRRVNASLAEDIRLRTAQARHLDRALRNTASHQDRKARQETFGPGDLATPPAKASGKAEDKAGGETYTAYPSAKSIALAKELDRKRQEARKLAGTPEPAPQETTGSGEDEPNFVPFGVKNGAA